MILGNVELPYGMIARPARSGDREFLASMYRANREDLRRAEIAPDYAEMAIEIQLKAQTIGYANAFPNAIYLVIERLQTRMGCLTLDIGTVELRLVNLDFIKPARGQKYRTGIILWLMQAAARTQRPLVVPCRRDKGRLASFLRRYGFRPDPSISDGLYWRMIWVPSAGEMNGIRAPLLEPRAPLQRICGGEASSGTARRAFLPGDRSPRFWKHFGSTDARRG